MNWSEGLRQKAAELFEQGLGYKAVSSELGVNRETVRDWSYTWRALGTDEFLKSHIGERIEYAPEIKVAVAQDRIAGMGVVEVMTKYHIPNRHRVKEWAGMYKLKGAQAFGLEEKQDNPWNPTVPS